MVVSRVLAFPCFHPRVQRSHRHGPVAADAAAGSACAQPPRLRLTSAAFATERRSPVPVHVLRGRHHSSVSAASMDKHSQDAATFT